MLELKSVDAGYGTFQALFGVSLEVRAGEAVGVIGPNGAGKTTLMRVISGLIRPRAGAISMEGTDVLKTPEHRIVSLGIAHVPENRRLFPRLTVEENLKMGAFMPEARARYAERLAVGFDLFSRQRGRRQQPALRRVGRYAGERHDPAGLSGDIGKTMADIFDIYLLEAVVNGILLGGVLALLALGLNLIFGVIDVTWICYAELVMIGMYGMYYLVQYFGLPYYAAAPLTILLVAALGALLHLLVIAPLLTAPPINQLLATGGVLFVLQSFATVAFGIDFRNLGIRLPVLRFGEMNFSYARLLAFGAALIGMVLVFLFMKRTFLGTAIRAISQDRQIMALMGVDTPRLSLLTSALGGALAGLASCLLVLQYDVHPFVGLSFGPITFLICVLGGLGNFVGGFVAAFVFAEITSLCGLFSDLEWGYVLAFAFFIAMMFIRPAGLLARRS